MSPEVWLGAMNFGSRIAADLSVAIIEHALSRGITRIDTSNSYGDGISETIVGDTVGKLLDVYVATKVGLARKSGQNEGLSPGVIRESVDASRRRLRRDAIDTLYLHAPDPRTPIDVTIGALVQLIDEGKIRSWSVSNYAAWQIAEMLQFCETRGLPKPQFSQVLYNVLVRQIELEYLAFARARSVCTIAYNPLAGGLLSGKHRHDSLPTAASRFAKNKVYQGRYWSRSMFDRVAALQKIAHDCGRPLVSLSYGWLAAQEGIAAVLVGPSAVSHIDEAIDALARPLDGHYVNMIDDVEAAASGTDVRYAR
jgi:aryl-alcohol dehydrogenase-like predicted oxidoreductase